MMASVNKFIGIGNITRDPDIRYMPNGEAVANFSIACNESWKDKNGQKQEKVEYINIVMYRKLAEIAGEYLKKGSSVYVEGRLETRKYTAKDGTEKQVTQVVADRMQMLGGSSSSDARKPAETQPQSNEQKADFNDFEDYIPF